MRKYFFKAEKDDKHSKDEEHQKNETKEKPNGIHEEFESKIDISEYIKPYTKELTFNDSYLAKNIENEYINLESDIQQLCLDKNDEEEEIENESLGKYLYKLKGIASNALKLVSDLKEALFLEFKKNNKIFQNLKINDPGCIVEFSCWAKNSLIDEKQFLKNFCEKSKKEEYSKEDFDLYLKLAGIYFQCLLSSEIIEFKYLKNYDIDFNNNEMYDLAQVRGNKKKVNFDVLPGLFYNKIFFQNGKIHVFCYIPNKTYKHQNK